jgi:hypothetical protein
MLVVVLHMLYVTIYAAQCMYVKKISEFFLN